jgi:hypothetical protein
LRRFRGGEPIVARPAGAMERGWRWCRRNPGTTGLLGAVAALLLLGTAVATGLALHADAQARRADQEASNAQQQAALAGANERTALQQKGRAEEEKEKTRLALAAVEEERNKARAEEAMAKEQEGLKARQLMTSQLMRVAAVYERDPGQALALLCDVNACPLPLRDSTWRFDERACSRWEVVALQRHRERVRCVAFSPDGLLLASGSGESDKPGEVRLWDARTGEHLTTLWGHTSRVWSVAYSPDGSTLASASADGTVRLWDGKTGQARASLRGHTSWVTCVAFSPDSKSVASASWDTVRLWDVATGQQLAVLKGHKGSVNSVAFSGDGERVFGWDDAGNVLAWRVMGGQPTDADGAPPRPSTLAVNNPDGTVRAEVRHDVVWLLDLKGFDAERERLALEPVNRLVWHQQQAARAKQDKDWLAVAFHLRQLRRERPEDLDTLPRIALAVAKQDTPARSVPLWEEVAGLVAKARQSSADPALAYHLALAQASAGDEAGYRGTCRELLRCLSPEPDAVLAGLLVGAVPDNAGSLALSVRLTGGRSPLAGIRTAALRASALKPEAADLLPRELPLSRFESPMYWAAACCRLKRFDEAATYLELFVSQNPLARVYLALTELGRGHRERAKQLLDTAEQSDRSRWPWEAQQEFEILRGEVEDLLTPPRMEKVPAP